MYKKFIIWNTIAALVLLPCFSTIQGAEGNSEEKIELRILSISPAAEPVPSMSYNLLPRYHDQKTGNAALLYYSAADFYPGTNPDEIKEKISNWRELPIEKLDRKEVEEVLAGFSSCFHQIKLASQYNDCQWELPLEEGFSMSMPHLGSFRNMIYAMQLQIRLYIADGKFDQALEMIQQGMYMAQSIAKGPTIIHGLVGISITVLMLEEVENLMQTENCPNLYWALTSLPDPAIDLRKAIRTEREVLFYEFPELRNMENIILSTKQASQIISDIINTRETLDRESIDNSTLKKLVSAGVVMAHYLDAKKYLAHKGYSQESIEEMPAAQAVLIYQKHQYMEISDNIYKWFEIPYYQSQPYLLQSEHETFNNQFAEGLKANIFIFFQPALYRVSFLQARLDRNIAQLRTIEAIRMYAGDNSGQLPDSLEQITSVPIPIDPVTGKDFIYKKTDNLNARLEAPVSAEQSDKTPVYELTMKQ